MISSRNTIQRKTDGDFCPLSFLTVDADASFMHGNQFGNKTQADARSRYAAGCLGAIETVHHLVEIMLWNADPVIPNREPETFAIT